MAIDFTRTRTPSFELVTELQTLTRRDFGLGTANGTSPNPDATNPLLDGEWLQLNASYAMERGGNGVADANLATVAIVPSWVRFTLRGDYPGQVLEKGTVLFTGDFEADTYIFASDGIALGGALYVGDVTYNALVRRGLLAAAHSGGALAAGALKIGYCTRTPATNNNKLRFISVRV